MKAEELLDLIGDADDQQILHAERKMHRPLWTRWAAIAACLCLVICGSVWFVQNMGGNAGQGGSANLSYMKYTGPVLPMTICQGADGITANRNINFDFSPYLSIQNDNTNMENYAAAPSKWTSEVIVTDRYTLHNESDEDQTISLLYPVVGNMRHVEYYPQIVVNRNPIIAQMYPGPDVSDFATNHLDEKTHLESFAGYKEILGTENYINAAVDPFPSMDIPVTVYKLHDYVYSDAAGVENPTLNMEFYMDYGKTFVFTYGMNGETYDKENGYRACHKSQILYQPDLNEKYQYPEDSYVIVVGDDLKSYSIKGYRDGGCDQGEELDDLGCTVTRYESTMGEMISLLMRDFEETIHFVTGAEENQLPSHEMMCNLVGEMLYNNGLLGNFPIKRYDAGMLENIFSAVYSDTRIIYFAFDTMIPAGESITVEARMHRDESCNFAGRDKGIDGYDMSTTLGSDLPFLKQSASISGYDEIQIVGQNFGFDPKNGVTEVDLDLKQQHYWMEIVKIR